MLTCLQRGKVGHEQDKDGQEQGKDGHKPHGRALEPAVQW